MAEMQGVRGPLYANWLDKGQDESLAQKLKSWSRDEAARDLLQTHSTQKFTELLAANNLPCLLLKGLPVAHLHYPAPWQRPRCDVDVYIREQDLGQVADLLSDNGYTNHHLGQRQHSSRQFQTVVQTAFNQQVVFDVHWKLSNRVMFQATLLFESCWEERQAVPGIEPAAFTLSNTGLLLHACIHRIAHGRNSGRDHMIWLYDIHLLASSMTTDEKLEFVGTALWKNIGTLCADALEVCCELFGTIFPSDLLAQLRKRQTIEPSARLIETSKLGWAWADIRSVEGFIPKAKYAKELLINKLS